MVEVFSTYLGGYSSKEILLNTSKYFSHKFHFFSERCKMDSDNSNRKTSYFHAQKILDAAADIKTKKVEEWGLGERQNDPIYLKIRVYSEKKITWTYILNWALHKMIHLISWLTFYIPNTFYWLSFFLLTDSR